MVSSGDSDIGAAKVTGEVLAIAGSILDMVQKTTGVDIVKKEIKAK